MKYIIHVKTKKMSKEIEKLCVLCKKSIRGAYGHNAEPLAKGRCCEECNIRKVLPERLANLFKSNKDEN